MSAKEGGSDNKVSLHIIVKTYLREEIVLKNKSFHFMVDLYNNIFYWYHAYMYFLKTAEKLVILRFDFCLT